MLFSNQEIKPCVIVLTTRACSSSFKTIDKGVKISHLIKIKKMLNSQNIDWEFATLGGKKSFINVESDDLNKDWLKENQEKLINPLNLEKLEAKNFSGIIFLNLLGYYSEFYPSFKKPNISLNTNSMETTKLKDQFVENANPKIAELINDFFGANKPIVTIGYGILMLFHAFNKDIWLFNKFNLTGISISEECRDPHFSHLPFLIEESVRELNGNFVYQNNSNQLFVTVDKNVICGQNDSSLMIAINNFCFLINKGFIYNI